jgi:hypothetical protein
MQYFTFCLLYLQNRPLSKNVKKRVKLMVFIGFQLPYQIG